MLFRKRIPVRNIFRMTAEFVKPGAHDRQRTGRASVAPVVFAPFPVGDEQALREGRRYGCRRQDDPAAQHPGPEHQTAQGMQIGSVKVVRLVQDKIGCHQAQHGRDLPPAADALRGRNKMIYRAGQNGRADQRRRSPCCGQPLGQRPIERAFILHIRLKQRLLRLTAFVIRLFLQ